MSRATDYLEQLGSDRRVVEPTVVDAIIGLGMVLDERLGQIHNVMIRIQMTGEELLAEARHIRAALNAAQDTRDYAYTPGDHNENGENESFHACLLNHIGIQFVMVRPETLGCVIQEFVRIFPRSGEALQNASF